MYVSIFIEDNISFYMNNLLIKLRTNKYTKILNKYNHIFSNILISECILF